MWTKSAHGVVWVLETSYDSFPPWVGGALCVDPSGVLITTTLVESPDSIPGYSGESIKLLPLKTKARNFKGQFRDVKLVDKWNEFGIAIYEVIERNTGELFECASIEALVELKSGLPVFSYTHECGLYYSHVFGNVTYPFPASSGQPFPSKPKKNLDTVRSLSLSNPTKMWEIRDMSMQKTSPFRTVGAVVDPITQGKGFVNFEVSLYLSLPLIEVKGLGMYDYGMTGCPVFVLKADGSICDVVGIIAFMKGSFQYILPLSVLYHVYKALNPQPPLLIPLALQNEDGGGREGKRQREIRGGRQGNRREQVKEDGGERDERLAREGKRQRDIRGGMQGNR